MGKSRDSSGARDWLARASIGVEAPPAVVDPSTPCPPGHLRFVCISDTHGLHGKMTHRIPEGHVLIHAGDFSDTGEVAQVASLERWLSCMPHEHKVVIAGNHDVTFHTEYYARNWERFHYERQDSVAARAVLTESASVIYLEDSGTTIHGLRIWGSPWQPFFCDWAYNLRRGAACAQKWSLIPDEVDVLITHGPVAGRGDACSSGYHAGCEDLLHAIRRRRIKFHVCGHVHEGYGASSDGVTTYVNASTCDLNYRASNAPIVFDVPLPSLEGAE